MTRQVPDTVRYRRYPYEVTAIDGMGLFNPNHLGMRPVGLASFCWRGFTCGYTVERDRLYLDELRIWLETQPPKVNRLAPSSRDPQYGYWTYSKVGLPISFSGRILIGADYLEEGPTIPFGFTPAWMFRDVWELTFDMGQLKSAADVSEELDEARAFAFHMQPHVLASQSATVDRAFSLDYDYSWPRRGY